MSTTIDRLRLSLRAVSPVWLGAAVLTLTTIVHLPTLSMPLLEYHSWRQTQTAWTALIFHQEGIDLLHPKVPQFGVPFDLPFEFPLFQALASLVMDIGISPDTALRATCLVTFVVSAALLWRLTVRLAGEGAGLVALVAFVASPLGLLWSRTSMIEYLATAAALGFLYFGLRWHEAPRRWLYAAALLAGLIAMLVKPFTAGLYLLPMVVLGIQTLRAEHPPLNSVVRYAAAMAVLFIMPIAVGLAWTAHSDAVKAASPFTAWLSSSQLYGWNFGTLDQRLDPETWSVIGVRVNQFLLGGASLAWVPLAVIGAVALSRRWFALALLVGGALGPLVFVNLYVIHDYYLMAVSPIFAFGVGVAAKWLWDRRTLVPYLIGTALAFAWLMGLYLTHGYWMAQFRPVVDSGNELPAAAFIAARSDPDELVVVTGREWDPAPLYYARRKGLMITGTPEESLARALGPELLPQLRAMGYRHLFECPYRLPCTRAFDITTDPPSAIP